MEYLSNVNFTLFTKGISAGRPQIYKNGGVGDTPRYNQFKKEIEEILLRDLDKYTLNHIMKCFEEGTGYEVVITCYYKVVNSDYWNTPMITTPDVDNVAKALFDQILGRLGINDSKIFDLRIRKYYGKENKIDFDINTYDIKKYESYNKVRNKERRKKRERKKEASFEERWNKYKEIFELD